MPAWANRMLALPIERSSYGIFVATLTTKKTANIVLALAGILPAAGLIWFETRLRFHLFQSIEISMGQQHRARAKRKRRLTYLRRKKVASRTAATRPAAVKQQTQKEAGSAE